MSAFEHPSSGGRLSGPLGCAPTPTIIAIAI
jgi:hypothetical protein